MSLHLKLLDIDHPLTFEESKLRQIEAHALIYLRGTIRDVHVTIINWNANRITKFFFFKQDDQVLYCC